jgi:hypothetical protein
MKPLLLLLSIVCASAAPVFETSAACTAFEGSNPGTVIRTDTGIPTGSGFTFCRLDDIAGFDVSAGAFPAYESFPSGFGLSANAYGDPEVVLGPNAALANASIATTFVGRTAGNVRPGIMRSYVDVSAAIRNDGSSATAELTFAGNRVVCQGVFATGECSFNAGPMVEAVRFEMLETSVLLGTDVIFSLLIDVEAYNSGIGSFGPSSGSIALRTDFFEADGLTPVSLFVTTPTEIPEPSTWMLAWSVIPVLVCARRRVRFR